MQYDLCMATVIGRLVSDPETKIGKDNKKWAKICLAVNNGEPQFIDVLAFNSLANVISTYTNKGERVAFVGKLSIENKTKKCRIIANSVQFFSEKYKGKNAEAEEISSGSNDEEDIPF